MNSPRSTTLLTVVPSLVAGVVSVRIAWQDLPPMPDGVAGGACALIGGTTLLYAGGTTWVDGSKLWLRDVRQYDLAGTSWTTGPPLPESLAYGGSIVTAHGFEIFGGMNAGGPSRSCWRLDPDRKHWSKTGVLPHDAVLAPVLQVGDAAYLFGGCSDANAPMHCSDDVWMRDPAGNWTRVSRMPAGPVAGQAATALDGRVYLFGGCSEVPGGVLNRDDAHRYDPATGEWRTLRPLPVAIRGLAAASLGHGRILLAGGYTRSEHGFSSEVWIYDAVNDRYENATPLPFGVAGIEIAIHGNLLFGLGGEDRMRGRSRRFIQGKME